jgi:hypothetical protein
LDKKDELLQFFDWYKFNPEAEKYTYEEFPTYFKWENSTWKERKLACNAVSRIYHVSVQAGELYYLRLLLLHIKGPTCHEDLKYDYENNLCET